MAFFIAEGSSDTVISKIRFHPPFQRTAKEKAPDERAMLPAGFFYGRGGRLHGTKPGTGGDMVAA